MPKAMTTPADRLKKLGELREAASPGPWRVVRSYEKGDVRWNVLSNGDANLSLRASELYEDDARLAAQAPALAASVEALGAALEGLMNEFYDMPAEIDEDGNVVRSLYCEVCSPPHARPHMDGCPMAISEQALATIPDLEEE